MQGVVKGRTYRLKGTGRYLTEDQVKIIDLKKNSAICNATNQPVVISWEKMSKSKHNGVDPGQMFEEHGVDTTRLLILADVAPTSHRNWNSNSKCFRFRFFRLFILLFFYIAFPGIINWQKRLWLTLQEFIKYRSETPKSVSPEQFMKHDDYMYDSRNYYTKGATFNYCQSQQISVAISKMQGLTNSLRVLVLLYREVMVIVLPLLACASDSFRKECPI